MQSSPEVGRHLERFFLPAAEVECNDRIAADTFRLRARAPEIARRILPGQFVMVRLEGRDDPLLARPLALYDTVCDESGQVNSIDLVYLVVGKLTARLAELRPGATITLWGPLGNGFASALSGAHLVMVAGGIGQTPFVALAAEQLGLRTYGDPPRHAAQASKVTLCYGARSSRYLAGVDDFQRLGVDVHVATDDGSQGHHGYVTDLVPPLLAASPGCKVVCCGPEPMMAKVAAIAAAAKVACDVSLETPMACGIGICFSCVAKVRQPDGSWDYRRTCVDGPVFDAQQIVW